MQNEMDVIQQYPLRLVVAFNAVRAIACLRELLLHIIRYGLDLARIGSGANNKIIGKCTTVPVHLQNNDVFALFTFNGLDRACHLLPDFYTHPFLWLLPACPWRGSSKDSILCPFVASLSAASSPVYSCSFLMYSATSRGTYRLSCFTDLPAAARIC